MDFHPPAARAEDAAARVEQKPVPANGPAPATEALRPEPFVSVVIPVYNEAQVLPLLLPRLLAALAGAAAGWEALFVNDGSSDGSFHILESQGRIDPHLKVIDLSRNFGHSAAITAGLDHARGDVVVVMDADLQDPPELIPVMVRRYREGNDVVHARRSARAGDGILKRAIARLYYRLLRALSEKAPEPDVGEFRLMSREVVAAFRRLRERHRLVRGLVAWVGFRQTVVEFERAARAAGDTKYPLSRMVALAWDGLTSVSAAPLRVATAFGFLALAAGVAYALYAVYLAYVLGWGVPGWTSLAIINVFFSGMVLVCLGLMGEYVARIFEEVKDRPLYFVRRAVNLEPTAPEEDAGARPGA